MSRCGLSLRQAIRQMLNMACPALVPVVRRWLHGWQRLYWEDAWCILPLKDKEFVNPENRGWIRRMEALAASSDTLPQDMPQTDHIHLVLLTGALVPGGAERQWCYLALELARRGYRVTLLLFHPLKGEYAHYLPLLAGSSVEVLALDDVLLPEGAPVVQPDGLPHEAWRLAVVLDGLRPARLLVQMDYNNVWGGMATLIQRCPPPLALLSFRNRNPSNFWFNQPYYRDYYRILLRSPRFVLNANSRSSAEDYAEWLGIDAARIGVAHNAVRVPDPDPETRGRMRRALGIPDTARVVLGVFRLSPEKNLPLFLAVANAVHEAMPETVFLHAGVGQEDTAFRQAAESSRMRDWFHLLGRREDIPDLMQAADVFLLCSDIEGLPNVLLEAQAAKLPIVATRVGGVSEAVVEGETALLADAGDERTLVRRCLDLLQNPRARERMGEAGRRFVETSFSATALGDAILKQLRLPPSVSEGVVSAGAPVSGQPVEIRYWQTVLERFLQSRVLPANTPLLIFASFPLSKAGAALLPEKSLCLTLPGVGQPPGCPAMELNWKDPQSGRHLKGKVPQGCCAVVLNGWPWWKHLEREMKNLGVTWIACPGTNGWYHFPVATWKAVRNVRGLARGLKKRWHKGLRENAGVF